MNDTLVSIIKIIQSFDWKLLLAYTNVLAWPIVAIYLSNKFSQDIRGLLKRITKGELPGGIKFDSPPSQDEKQTESTPKTKEIEKIKSDLDYTQIYLDFERIYRLIFGSQIELLKRLRLQESIGGEELKNTASFFVLTQNFYELLKSWTFDQYLKFLFDAGLIHMKNDRYLISDKGKAFLSYIEFLNFPSKSL